MKTFLTTLAVLVLTTGIAFAKGETGEQIKQTFKKVGEDIKRDFSNPAKDFFEGIPDYARCMTDYKGAVEDTKTGTKTKCSQHLTENQQEERDRLFAGMDDVSIKMHAEYSLDSTQFVLSGVDVIRDPDSSGPETGFADSGNEGSTSAAQESDQQESDQ